MWRSGSILACGDEKKSGDWVIEYFCTRTSFVKSLPSLGSRQLQAVSHTFAPGRLRDREHQSPLPQEQTLEGWILIVCLAPTTLLNNIRRGEQIPAAYFSPEDVCEPRETPQYMCTRRARKYPLKISPNQNSFPTHKQRTPTLVTHSALPIHWRHNDCPIFLKSHWKWFHSYKWLINM